MGLLLKALKFSIYVPAGIVGAVLVFVLLPYFGFQQLGNARGMAGAPFLILMGMSGWVLVGHDLVRALGIRRIGSFLVAAVLTLAIYFGAIASLWIWTGGSDAVDAPRESRRLDYDAAPADLRAGWLNIGYVLAAVGVVVTFGRSAQRSLQMRRYIDHLAVTSPGGVAYGLCEAVGVVRPGDGASLLRAPVSKQDCVGYWRFAKRRRKEKTFWAFVEKECLPVFLTDESGAIRLDLDQARFGGGTWTVDDTGENAERVLSNESRVYVFGEAKLDETTGDTLVITENEDSSFQLHVSTESEEDVVKKYIDEGFSDLWWVICAAGAIPLLLVPFVGFSTRSLVALALLSPPLLLLVLSAALYVNDLVILKRRAERDRANVDVAAKKRADLIPRLRDTVALVMKWERETLPELRSASAWLGRFEDHPALTSNDAVKNFLRLLVVQENELALSRDAYNDAVRQYRARRYRFPDRVIANVLRLRDLDYLEADAEFRRIPSALER